MIEIPVTISIDDLHPEKGWGIEGDQCLEYIEEINKEFGAKFTLFIPSNYHNKFPISNNKDWINFLLSKNYFELASHGHYHSTSDKSLFGEMEFFDITEEECIHRIKNILKEWNTVEYKPKGWRNPGWICKDFCVKHISKEFEWAALHYQHNKNFKWDLKMIFGADGINIDNLDLHDGKIMFQSHIAGDWNSNCWNEANYYKLKNTLNNLQKEYTLVFKTISEV